MTFFFFGSGLNSIWPPGASGSDFPFWKVIWLGVHRVLLCWYARSTLSGGSSEKASIRGMEPGREWHGLILTPEKIISPTYGKNTAMPPGAGSEHGDVLAGEPVTPI